jgi:hypothetical protein
MGRIDKCLICGAAVPKAPSRLKPIMLGAGLGILFTILVIRASTPPISYQDSVALKTIATCQDRLVRYAKIEALAETYDNLPSQVALRNKRD